jgi:hypothetical protein
MKGFYLLHVFRGVDISVLGPYATEDARSAEVRAVYQGEAREDFSEWDRDYDSLFAMDVDELGRPSVWDFPTPDDACECEHFNDTDRPHDHDCPARTVPAAGAA